MALPQDSIKISNSPNNGKARVITVTGINIRLDLREIKISTVRRTFEPVVDINDVGIELTGKVDFPPYERQLVANNDTNHLCNPSNGVSCYPAYTTDADGNQVLSGYTDALGNIVANPIGLFDFFKPLLSQPIALMNLIYQNIQAEDQIYKTWDK